MPPRTGSVLVLDAARARRLLLARALDEADPQGRLVGAGERDQAEREALVATLGRAPAPDDAPDPARYLDERARRLIAIVERRDPQVAGQQHGGVWQRWLVFALPVLALFAGALLERIDNPRQVNMLSPPLLAFIAWNLVLYVLLVARMVWPRGRTSGAGLMREVGETLTRRIEGRRGARAAVIARMHLLWWQLAGGIESLRMQRLLHASSAAWAVGVAITIVLGGLVREYRVGWESTLLDLPQVHALLRALFAPVVAVLPVEGFSLADVQRMHFRSGADVGQAEARHWIALYLGLLGLVVFVPRVLLALLATLRMRWLERSLRIDLSQDYYARLLSQVSPVRVTIGWHASDQTARTLMQRLWREAVGFEDGASLRTDRGDELELIELASPSPAGGGQGWGPPPPEAPLTPLARLTRWLRAAPANAPAPGPAAPDLIIVCGESAAAAQPPTDTPTLVLRRGPATDTVLSLRSASCWAWEAPLHAAIGRTVPAHKRPGMQRLVASWNAHHTDRLQRAMREFAQTLVATARDAQPVDAGAWSFKRIVDAEHRDAAQLAREQATQVLIGRIGALQEGCMEKLRQLYAPQLPTVHATTVHPTTVHPTTVRAEPVEALPDQASPSTSSGRTGEGTSSGRTGEGTSSRRTGEGTSSGRTGYNQVRHRQSVDAPQAGLAGAASGAAAGATIDLMTGGLTLGAATALGAAIGGGAAMVAAAWRNRSTPSGQGQVEASNEMLQALAEALLVQYARVAIRDASAPGLAPAEAVALVEARASALSSIWDDARRTGTAPTETKLPGTLAGQLESIARELLARVDELSRR